MHRTGRRLPRPAAVFLVTPPSSIAQSSSALTILHGSHQIPPDLHHSHHQRGKCCSCDGHGRGANPSAVTAPRGGAPHAATISSERAAASVPLVSSLFSKIITVIEYISFFLVLLYSGKKLMSVLTSFSFPIGYIMTVICFTFVVDI